MDKADHEYKLHKGFYLPSLKRELDRSMNEDNFPKQILEKIMWFRLQGILKHAAYHSKVKNILLY